MSSLDNGIKIEAGRFIGSTTLQQVSLQQTYNASPVTMPQIMTENGTDIVTNKVLGINLISFELM